MTRKQDDRMDYVGRMGLLALGTRFKRLGERLQGEVAKVLKHEGIEFGRRWGPLFFMLNERGPMPIGEAAALLGLTHPAVSQFSKEMAEAGLVSSEADAKDERKRILRVTRSGAALHRRMLPVLRDIEGAMGGVVREIDLDVLDALCRFEAALDRRSGFERVREQTRARQTADVEIVAFEDQHAAAFKRLNLAWINKHFRAEDLDRKVLTYPRKEIIEKGGAILFARLGGKIVGTCGLKKIDSRTYELCKMAVADAAQGRGVGEKLARAVIEKARARGARRLELETHHKLATAIRLYEKLGFERVPMPTHSHYARTDVAMSLRLE